jgi:hypothetical protein
MLYLKQYFLIVNKITIISTIIRIYVFKTSLLNSSKYNLNEDCVKKGIAITYLISITPNATDNPGVNTKFLGKIQYNNIAKINGKNIANTIFPIDKSNEMTKQIKDIKIIIFRTFE